MLEILETSSNRNSFITDILITANLPITKVHLLVTEVTALRQIMDQLYSEDAGRFYKVESNAN